MQSGRKLREPTCQQLRLCEGDVLDNPSRTGPHVLCARRGGVERAQRYRLVKETGLAFENLCRDTFAEC
jgi:hypothetical protein